MNYVWNERMLSGINHFGGGVGSYGNRAASYIDEKGRGRANLIKDGNRYFYQTGPLQSYQTKAGNLCLGR